MVDSEYHSRPVGPLAKPGGYTATLTVGDWSMSQTFQLVRDPRVDVTDDDLDEQFQLLLRIQAKLSETATAVNSIRGLRKQLGEWSTRLDGDDRASDALAAASAIGDRLTAIEEKLVQVELTSEGDSLNYREMLFEKLVALEPVVSSADARPTVQSHQVFEKLAGQIDEQLAALQSAIDNGLADVNRQLLALGVEIIGA
jgi:hypothetical protein